MCRLSTLRECTLNLEETWATSLKCSLQEQERAIQTHQQRGAQRTSPHLQLDHSLHFLMVVQTVRGKLTMLPKG